jgi:hypothetical protein
MLGCDAVRCGGWLPTFRRNLHVPSSVLKISICISLRFQYGECTEILVTISLAAWCLKMEVTCSSETWVSTYHTALWYNAEDLDMNLHSCWNVKPEHTPTSSGLTFSFLNQIVFHMETRQYPNIITHMYIYWIFLEETTLTFNSAVINSTQYDCFRIVVSYFTVSVPDVPVNSSLSLSLKLSWG